MGNTSAGFEYDIGENVNFVPGSRSPPWKLFEGHDNRARDEKERILPVTIFRLSKKTLQQSPERLFLANRFIQKLRAVR